MTWCVRRILQRPLNTDPFIKATLTNFISGRTSIINTIQHSDVFNTDLAHFITAMEAGIDSRIRPPPRIGSPTVGQ